MTSQNTLPSKKIIFFGNERIATGYHTTNPVLRALIKNGYDICAVITNYAQPQASRSHRQLEVKELAESNNIPVLVPNRLADIRYDIENFGAQAAVLVAYGKIIPDSIIDIFPRGIINIHPSILPAHRGPTPIESAILRGDKRTGVSLMRLAEKMDAGPVFAQVLIDLKGTETKQYLADYLLDKGSELLIEHLSDILENKIKPTPQDDSLASYDQLINKSDSLISWLEPAEQIERKVRAYADWPKTRTSIGNIDVAVTGAEIVDTKGPAGTYGIENNEIVFYCGQKALKIKKLIPSGKPEMTTESFLAGYRDKL